MVTLAEALMLGFAWLVAVTVTAAGFGTVLGAVYEPWLVIVPTVELP
jgi:hypothetical protein